MKVIIIFILFLIVIVQPVQGQDVTHIVEPGENLYRISLKYDVSMDAIATANNLYDVNVIYVGQELIIPVPVTDSPPVAETEAIIKQEQITLSGMMLNGLPIDTFTVMDDETIQHVQEIYAVGQAINNDPQVIAKVGDSITVSLSFLHPMARGVYNLGEYGYLQETVSHYVASFGRPTNAARVGWAAFAALDSAVANRNECLPDEPPLVCEYRIMKPSIALIMFGTNDMGYRSTTEFRNDLTRIVEYTEGLGIIPVLSTIPPRPRYETTVNAINDVVREVSETYHIPLLDYHLAMVSLPNLGLSPIDNLHPSSPPNGYDGSADFRAQNLGYGYVVRNLTALHMLYTIRQITGQDA